MYSHRYPTAVVQLANKFAIRYQRKDLVGQKDTTPECQTSIVVVKIIADASLHKGHYVSTVPYSVRPPRCMFSEYTPGASLWIDPPALWDLRSKNTYSR